MGRINVTSRIFAGLCVPTILIFGVIQDIMCSVGLAQLFRHLHEVLGESRGEQN